MVGMEKEYAEKVAARQKGGRRGGRICHFFH
jgi:hypothetical protein